MDTIFTTTAYSILEVFMQYPDKKWSARGIGRHLHLSHATVLTYLEYLCSARLIMEDLQTLYPTYCGNQMYEQFKFYKKQYIEWQLYTSGVVGAIREACVPSTIVLFGSCAQGTYDEHSDVDVFVQATRQDMSLRRFEKKLGRSINLLFEPALRTLSDSLRHTIMNGTILYGFVRWDC